jgi:hypothetical protein
MGFAAELWASPGLHRRGAGRRRTGIRRGTPAVVVTPQPGDFFSKVLTASETPV